MNNILKPQSANQDYGNDKKLLHFGADWITFNIAQKNPEITPASIRFLESLFSLSHNDTNASEYDDFIWADSAQEVMLQFGSDIQMGEVLKVNGHKGKSLLQIIKINSDWAENIRYPYAFKVDCYGTLFDYDRLGIINAKEMLAVFFSDIERNLVSHSVSRIDICADLTGYKVKSIQRGITGSKAHMKKITVFNTANPETMNYGTKKDKWMARAYNKLLDVTKKKKEWIFLRLGYFDHVLVTRLETEARSDICLNNALTLPLCFDNEYLFGIYKSLLSNKLVEFTVIPFIESELKKAGYKIITPIKRDHDPKQLSQQKYIKRIAGFHISAMERYDIPHDVLLKAINEHIKPETGIGLNQEHLATEEDFRKVFNINQL